MKKDHVIVVRRILLFIVIVAHLFLIDSCAVFNEHWIIDYYHDDYYADSSVSICAYLTVRQYNGRYGTISFVDMYPNEKVFYRFEHLHVATERKECETVLLSVIYEEAIYEMAKENVVAQPGYSNEYPFVIGDFVFCWNSTDTLYSELSSFNLTNDQKSIEWINLVGFSDKKKTLCFIGFYYAIFDSFIGSKPFLTYSFTLWSDLFNEFFGFYKWR